MIKSAGFLCFAIACCLLLAQGTADGAEKPNIIFILADDLGYGDLGCFGQKKIKTPNLDEMAAQGMRFTQFYAGATVCAPSRCVLMTGLHTGHCQVRGNGAAKAQSLTTGTTTVATLLQQAGYETVMIGKWGLGEPGGGETGFPNKQGFDYFFGYLSQHHAHNYYPEILWENTQKVHLRNVVTKVKTGPWGSAGYATKRIDYSHDLFMDKALSFLDRHHDKPFFLYLPLTIPHANNEGTRGTGNGQEVPDYGIYQDLDWTEQNKGQAAMITRMDSGIGKIFERLKKHKLDKNTIVCFSSDNGHHREGGNDPEFFDANGPLRGMKRDLYEGGIRVPTIFRWPGKITAGTISNHIGYFGDFLATAGDLAGITPPEKTDSISLVPGLTGRSQQQKQHDYLYWEFYEQGSKQAIRKGKWKAIRMPMFNGTMELYDLSSDLHEENDLAKQHPELVSKFAELMDKAHVDSPLWKVKPRRR